LTCLLLVTFLYAVTNVMAAEDAGTVTLTQAGTAGITVDIALLQFGSGYYDPTCTQGYSILDSLGVNSSCWTNTTAYLSNGTHHVISNTGTAVMNVTVDTDQTDAEQLFCGDGGCVDSTDAEVRIETDDNETGSCGGGLQKDYAGKILDDQAETLTSVCSLLNFEDAKDEVRVYYKLILPKQATTGAKTLTVTYEGIAV